MIQNHIVVETTEGARWLRRRLRLANSSASLTLAKPLRDRGVPPPADGGNLDCAASQLQRADANLFDKLGPSAKCANPALLRAPWARAPGEQVGQLANHSLNADWIQSSGANSLMRAGGASAIQR